MEIYLNQKNKTEVNFRFLFNLRTTSPLSLLEGFCLNALYISLNFLLKKGKKSNCSTPENYLPGNYFLKSHFPRQLFP